MEIDKPYTLITGSSMGIGKCLALECASKGMNVLLVALEEPLLTELAQTIRQDYAVQTDHLSVNLTDPQATQTIYEWCTSKGYRVNMLLSNAGMGMSGLYEKNPLEKYRRMVLLNNMAAVELTHHFLPMLKAQGEAYLMYTSSMEATIPLPYKAVYSGSKHFLYGFSLALREELREFGIHVSVLCPGPVPTHAGTLARMEALGKPPKFGILPPEEVARQAINGLLRKRQIIVPGTIPALAEVIAGLMPRGPKMRILRYLFRKYRDVQM